MRRSILVFSFVLLVLASLAGTLSAQPLVGSGQSSLFGYQLGMSFEEAETLRPFDEIHPSSEHSTENLVVGTLHGFDQDGVPLKCSVAFKDDRLTRVVASFDVADLAPVKWQIEKALGPGVERTRTKKTSEVTIAQTSLIWETAATLLKLTVFPQVTQTFSLVLQGKED